MKNIKAAKELLEMYKSITIEEIEQIYKSNPYYKGKFVMSIFTGFGTIYCILCTSANHTCSNCIYSFRNEKTIPQCKDIIYKEMENETSSIELFNALQKRISYLTHIIEWYETMDSKR